MLQKEYSATVATLAMGQEAAVPAKGMVLKNKWLAQLMTFLMVFGPGLIVMEADNDAGAVSTYVQAGAQYGLHLLWILLVLLPITYCIQEMVVRLGIVTGQGHAAMIYKRFGKWWGRFSLIDLQLLNFLTLVTEFAAISLAVEKLGIPAVIGVPVAALGLMAMVFTGSYLRWERIVVILCLMDLAWLGLAWSVGPGAFDVIHHTLVPQMPKEGLTSDLMFLIIAIVGTTIAPWQLFFQQSCVADKRLRFSDLKWARLDTFIGAVFTIIVAGSMMVAGSSALAHGVAFSDPAQMVTDLAGVTGGTFRNVFLLLMINAAVLGTTAVSLSSSWAYGEVMGWPHSLHKKIKDAPGFYAIYGLCIALAAAIVLIPQAPLQLIILSVQVLAGLMLPSAIIFLQLLLNDKELLGKYVNTVWNNRVNWAIIIVLFIMSLILAVQVLAPNLFTSAPGGAA